MIICKTEVKQAILYGSDVGQLIKQMEQRINNVQVIILWMICGVTKDYKMKNKYMGEVSKLQ